MIEDIEIDAATVATERTPRIGQVVRSYLADARRRETQRAEHIRLQSSIWETYTTPGFRSVRFEQIDAIDMQKIIDRTAAGGDEKAAVWLRRLFDDTDRFAAAQGIIPSVRTKRLASPSLHMNPRPLSDQAFRSAWETYSYCAAGGAVVDREPCLAILVSAITLQPLGNVVSMRRDEIDFEKNVWARDRAELHVHLSDLALDHIRKGVQLGDFMHREVETPFVFPSSGSKRDPYRYTGYSSLYDLTKRLITRQATPHDLRKTGTEALRSFGGDIWNQVKAITKGGTENAPDQAHVAILDGWSEKIRSLTRKEWC